MVKKRRPSINSESKQFFTTNFINIHHHPHSHFGSSVELRIAWLAGRAPVVLVRPTGAEGCINWAGPMRFRHCAVRNGKVWKTLLGATWMVEEDHLVCGQSWLTEPKNCWLASVYIHRMVYTIPLRALSTHLTHVCCVTAHHSEFWVAYIFTVRPSG